MESGAISHLTVTLEKRDVRTAQILVEFDPHRADALSGNISSSLASSAA